MLLTLPKHHKNSQHPIGFVMKTEATTCAAILLDVQKWSWNIQTKNTVFRSTHSLRYFNDIETRSKKIGNQSLMLCFRQATTRTNKRSCSNKQDTSLFSMKNKQQQQQQQQKQKQDSTATTTTTSVRLQQQKHQTNCFYLPSDPNGIYPIHYVVAPMVAASDYAFRCLCRQYYNNNNNDNANSNDVSSSTSTSTSSTLLTFTQMLHARKVVQERTFRINHYDFYEYNTKHGSDGSSSSSSSIIEYSQLLPTQRSLLGYDEMEYTKRQLQFLSSSSSSNDNIKNNENSDDTINEQKQKLLLQSTKGPLIVQLAGNDPKIVVDAALMLLESTSKSNGQGQIHGFDLNCGCPQDIARKGKYGAFLMEQNEQLVCTILKELRTALPNHISVSAKIRLPIDSTNLLSSRLHSLQQTGINFLTIHGRTIKENKTTVGSCNFYEIQRAVELLSSSSSSSSSYVPIVSNGGIECYNDIEQIRSITGAAAVMSSEAILETPNLFTIDSTQLQPMELLNQQIQFAYDYLWWCSLYPPVPGVISNSMNVVRGHLFKFLYRYLSYNIEFRNELASTTKLQTIEQAKEFIQNLYQFYSHCNNYKLLQLASQRDSSWYRRHWNSVTSTVRRDSLPTSLEMVVSIEERKIILKSRIEKLQKTRLDKEQQEQQLSATTATKDTDTDRTTTTTTTTTSVCL